MLTQYGPWALILGGSEGLGPTFAEELAQAGLNVLLVARTAAKLDQAAAGLRAAHPDREVRTLATDLSEPAGADAVIAAAAGLEIGLMIYNAGACSQHRDFLDSDLAFSLKLAQLNVMTSIRLTHAFGGAMRARGRGGIMIVGSSSYSAGNPGFATYAGVKAFGTLFAEGLWHELRPSGVHVLGYIVTFTATPAIARDFPAMAGQGSDPADVARYGLSRLPHGPVAYCAGAEDRVRGLMALPRDQAVEQIYERSKPYRNPVAS